MVARKAPFRIVHDFGTSLSGHTIGVKVSTLPGNNISTAMVSKNDFVSDTTAVYVENNGSATTFGNNRFVDVFVNFYPAPAPMVPLK